MPADLADHTSATTACYKRVQLDRFAGDSSHSRLYGCRAGLLLRSVTALLRSVTAARTSRNLRRSG
jgi:hypothetical protein